MKPKKRSKPKKNSIQLPPLLSITMNIILVAISLPSSIFLQQTATQKLSKTNNPYLNLTRTPQSTKLALTKLYHTNNPISAPESNDAFNYLNSGSFLTNQDEFQLEQTNQFQFSTLNCTLDRFKLIARINALRIKHQVSKLQWDPALEAQARVVAEKTRDENNCAYQTPEAVFSEVFSENFSRLSEAQVVEKWYEPAFHFDFIKKHFKLQGINAEAMLNLLWDDTQKVGCARVCCIASELWVCEFWPVLVQPGIVEVGQHIKANRFLKLK